MPRSSRDMGSADVEAAAGAEVGGDSLLGWGGGVVARGVGLKADPSTSLRDDNKGDSAGSNRGARWHDGGCRGR